MSLLGPARIVSSYPMTSGMVCLEEGAVFQLMGTVDTLARGAHGAFGGRVVMYTPHYSISGRVRPLGLLPAGLASPLVLSCLLSPMRQSR